MKNILIVIATELEVRPLLHRLNISSTISTPSTTAWPALSLDNDNYLTITGIGKTNAAAAVACALTNHPHVNHINHVINLGLAGSLPDNPLSINDTIIATESIFADEGIHLPTGWEGVNTLGFPLAPHNWAQGNRIQNTPDLTRKLHQILKTSSTRTIRQGPIATVDTCSGTDAAAREILHRTNALAEAMEGAAVVATARRMKKSAAEIRIISNTTGDRDKQQWNIKSALTTLDQTLQQILTASN